MIYLSLFLNFLKIGAVSFGGGLGMIALIKETVISSGWLTESAFLDFVAVAESTPGPLAVNVATFVGSSVGGFFGALPTEEGLVTFCATERRTREEIDRMIDLIKQIQL